MLPLMMEVMVVTTKLGFFMLSGFFLQEKWS